MHPFLHPDPAVLGSIPTFPTKHIETHLCPDDAGGFFAAGRARFRA